jgi:tight adherence protein C
MLLLLLAAALVGVAAYVALEATTVRQKQLAVALRRAKGYGGFSLRQTDLGKGLGERVVAPSLERLAELAMKLPMTASLDETRRRLIAAGLGQRVSPTTFLAAKSGLAAAGVVLNLLGVVAGSQSLAKAFMLSVAAAAAAFFLPDTYLTIRMRSRKEDIKAQMPDILDLLCVSVEAGLGFDAALGKVSEKMEGPLVEEVSIMLQEMRIGESRAQALKNFGERLDLPETTSFARSIIQADQLGISLGRILRVQAADMRNRRQMAAEEKAMKAPVKMLFPTVLFIFPAMFIVVLGPALLGLTAVLSGV